MATISLTFENEDPASVAVTALTRADTGETVAGVTLPATMTFAGGSWNLTFTEPAIGLHYDYSFTITWDDGTTTTGSATFNGTTVAEGYYAKRRQVLITAGTDNFNAAFNLDADSDIADETLVQEVLDLADQFVDDTAYELGVTKADDDHYVLTTHEAYTGLSYWASRWARAQGYLIRGVVGGDQSTGPEGQMTAMKSEASEKIRALLLATRRGSYSVTMPGIAGSSRATAPLLVI